MKKSASGYTITELLVVIVVIAILASIVTVVYAGMRNRGYDVSVQADMRTIAKKLQEAKIEKFSYPASDSALVPFVDARVNKGSLATSPALQFNMVVCYPSTTSPTQYALLAQSKSGNRFYLITGGAITQYTGASSWNTDANSMCNTVQTGWVSGAAGYSSADTTTGPWRSWAGGN